MTKTITEILSKTKPTWQVVTEEGKVLEEFRNKVTAQQSISRLKLNRYDKLKIVEVKKK